MKGKVSMNIKKFHRIPGARMQVVPVEKIEDGEELELNVKERMQVISGLCGMKLTPGSIQYGKPLFSVEEVAYCLGFYETLKQNDMDPEKATNYTLMVLQVADPYAYQKLMDKEIDGIPEDSVYKMLMMIDTEIAYNFRDFVVKVLIPYFKKNYLNGKYNHCMMKDKPGVMIDMDSLSKESVDMEDFNSWMLHVEDLINQIKQVVGINNPITTAIPITEDQIALGMIMELMAMRYPNLIDRNKFPEPMEVYKDGKLRDAFERCASEIITTAYKKNHR